ncbi:hypothetical protein [Nevskia sp.]|uniref:hypothetical protein n=1 Tax=Nevskia sp. TaxID=1929292 RepID=UPI0025E381C5|nr:hypothetical protein [Nevskia sp.]
MGDPLTGSPFFVGGCVSGRSNIKKRRALRARRKGKRKGKERTAKNEKLNGNSELVFSGFCVVLRPFFCLCASALKKQLLLPLSSARTRSPFSAP